MSGHSGKASVRSYLRGNLKHEEELPCKEGTALACSVFLRLGVRGMGGTERRPAELDLVSAENQRFVEEVSLQLGLFCFPGKGSVCHRTLGKGGLLWLLV